MSPGFPSQEDDREVIADTLGLWIEDTRLDELRRVLDQRRGALGDITPGAYRELLTSPGEAGEEERQALADRLTVGESYFFRNPAHMEELRGRVLPELFRRPGTLRLLSAGCSRGEEPYTLAILLRELQCPPERAQVEALDLSPLALEQARAGRYGERALRAVDPVQRDRFFLRSAGTWTPVESLKATVRFRRYNLGAEDGAPVPGGPYHLILCRNVLMYLRPDRAAAAMASLEASLAEGGFLFLGHAESVRALARETRLSLIQTDDTFYYHLSDAARQSLVPTKIRHIELPPPGAPAPEGVQPEETSSVPEDGDWYHAIADAGRRIQSLCALPPPESAPPPSEAPPAGSTGPTPRADLPAATAAYRRGAFEQAEQLATSLLAGGGEPRPEAHLILGLCAAARADLAEARRHFKAATFLDPRCAFAQLHLGITLRDLGERGAAARALRHALRLLPDEDPRCIGDFGGALGSRGLATLARRSLQGLEERAS